jgi:hypothetical protein
LAVGCHAATRSARIEEATARDGLVGQDEMEGFRTCRLTAPGRTRHKRAGKPKLFAFASIRLKTCPSDRFFTIC